VIVPGLEPDAYPRLGAGDIFGEASLLGGEPRRADVRAEGALTALRIPKHTLTQLVQLHPGLGDVLFEMLTRRLLANLLHTSRVFAELGPVERREVAAEFELRRARGGTQLLVPGKRADALYITLTGQVEVQTPGAPARVEGAGMMFGHASMLEGGACEAGVRTLDTLLVLRLPRQAFSRVAMQYPAILMRLSELEQVARVGQ
jgi:CRP-like cAMP-binding protein